MNIEDAKTVAILGRQPALGIAELESLYGHESILPYSSDSCFINMHHSEIDFTRLGSSVRLAKILTKLSSTKWKNIEKHLIENTPIHAKMVEGKLSFGISVYGVNASAKQITRTALLMKKAIKAAGNSVRMVPHNDLQLGSAQVIHNKLTSDNGWEILVISNGESAYLALTTQIQDIESYTARDRERPMRDAKVGMLPPKLAQTIVNLAVSKLDDKVSPLVLDPFCGTGVLLQEATLMDYNIYGTDLEPRMIQYTIENLNWLDEKYPDVGDYRRVEVGDATKFKWDFSKIQSKSAEIVVACETYLGQPLSALPSNEHLSKIIYEVNLLHHKFLENIAKQIPSGTRLCLALPTWRGKHEFLHLPTLDHLEDLGYNRISLKRVSNEDLIYHREGQVVGRELLIIKKD